MECSGKNGIDNYLTKEGIIEKYPFLTMNMLRNLLFKDVGGFRTKVVKKLGKRVLFDEKAFLLFLSNLNHE